MSRENLSEEIQTQYDSIVSELQPFLTSETYRQGMERVDQILNSIPETEDFRLLRAALFARRAELHLELEDDEAAWEDAQKAMNGGWYDASIYSISGWAMYNVGKLDLAIGQFDEAIKIDPDRISSLMGRALVNLESEEYDLSRTDISRVIQLDETNASALATRAEISAHLGTLEAARKDIWRARELEPSDPDYGLLHARLLVVDNQSKNAVKALDETISEEEALLESLLLRSHLKLLIDDIKGARRDAIRASNSFPDEAVAFVQLAFVQYSGESHTLARKAADRAVELDPSLSDAYYVRYLVKKATGDDSAEVDLTNSEKASLELPLFLMGPLTDAISSDSFLETFAPPSDGPTGGPDAANPFPDGLPPIPGLGGIDPSKMLDQVFDSEGNIKPMFKPLLKMAMKNMPALMQTVPDSMLKQGNIDKEQIENLDMSQLSEEQLEEQMKMFYKMVKSGQNPLDPKGGD